MATREEMLSEAYRRGILPADIKAQYEEAMQRGLVGGGKAPGVKAPDPNDPSWLDVPGLALKNAPASAWRLAQNLGDAVMHPYDTLKAAASVPIGLGHKVVRAFTGDEKARPEEAAADALIQYGKDRISNPKQTIAYDPIGALADISTVFTGGAGGARALATAGRVARLPANVVRALEATNAGLGAAARATDPLGVVMRTPGAAADAVNATARKIGWEPPIRGNVFDAAARKLYEQGLNLNVGFSSTKKPLYSPEDIRAIVDTGLQEQIPLTPGGYRRSRDRVIELNDRVDKAIADAEAGGITASPQRVVEGAIEGRGRQVLADQPTPFDDLRAYDDALEEYMAAHGVDNQSISGMQRTKKAAYEVNQARYKNSAKPIAHGKTEAVTELGRQLRAEIGRAVDEAHAKNLLTDKEWTSIHDINAREGNLIELRDAIERTLQKSGKSPLFNAMMAGIFSSATNDLGLGVAAAAALQGLKTPWFRSQAALNLHNLGQTGLPSNLHTPAWALQHYMASQPAIQSWYQSPDGYGGLIGEMERSR